MIYFIFTPSLWATQGQWYSYWQVRQQALSLPGFFPSPLRRSMYGRKQLTCEQGLLGTNPEAVSMLTVMGWPWVSMFSLYQASVSLFVKKKWSPRGDFYGPLSTLSAIWRGFLHVPWHPNSSNGAFALLFLWLLMPFYFLALSDIPFLHPGDCFHAHLSDFRSTSQARRCLSTQVSAGWSYCKRTPGGSAVVLHFGWVPGLWFCCLSSCFDAHVHLDIQRSHSVRAGWGQNFTLLSESIGTDDLEVVVRIKWDNKSKAFGTMPGTQLKGSVISY